MSTREMHEIIATNIKIWERLDKESAELMKKTLSQCDHPLVCMIMEIIRRDSDMHVRVLEFIRDSIEKKPITMGLEQFGEIVDLIQAHLEVKQQMVEATEESVNSITDKSLGLQRFLLNYLLADEKKHKAMLDGINRVKRNLYPYWAH